MTTNARDEKWSEWIVWSGGSAPLAPAAFVEVKTRDGDIEDGEAVAFYWLHDREPSDIIAYRYKIKEPESDINEDLYWLAKSVTEWPDDYLSVRRDNDFTLGYCFTKRDDVKQANGWYTREQYHDARQQLGLDSNGIAEPDEEECLQLAYERMGDESVKVSIEELQDNVNKPKHYQLREGYEVYDLRQDLAAKAANGGATYDQYSDWDRAIEYIIRMWGKNRLEDAKKGRWYLDKLIGKLEDQG